MNIEEEKLILKNLIEGYLSAKETTQDLYNFAWEKIEFFTKNKDFLPEYDKYSEGDFWYAIWQIQHLADTDHEKNGLLKRELLKILHYLENEKFLPENLYGKRPI